MPAASRRTFDRASGLPWGRNWHLPRPRGWARQRATRPHSNSLDPARCRRKDHCRCEGWRARGRPARPRKVLRNAQVSTAPRPGRRPIRDPSCVCESRLQWGVLDAGALTVRPLHRMHSDFRAMRKAERCGLRGLGSAEWHDSTATSRSSRAANSRAKARPRILNARRSCAGSLTNVTCGRMTFFAMVRSDARLTRALFMGKRGATTPLRTGQNLRSPGGAELNDACFGAQALSAASRVRAMGLCDQGLSHNIHAFELIGVTVLPSRHPEPCRATPGSATAEGVLPLWPAAP